MIHPRVRLIQTARPTRNECFAETKPEVLLLRPSDGFQRFHTASVIRVGFAMSVLCPLRSALRTHVGRRAKSEKGHKRNSPILFNRVIGAGE